MSDLFQLIAVEGFYQICREQAARQRVLLSRVMFCEMRHTVVLNVDFMLVLFKAGFALPQAMAMPSPANGAAAPRLVH